MGHLFRYGAASFAAAPGAGKPPMKVAILGAGMQGLGHLAAFARHPSVDGVVVADLEPLRARAAAERFGVAWAPPDSVFDDNAVGAVVIAAPTQAHLPLARRAVAAGKHVLCEKPFGADSGPAAALAERAAAVRLVAQVGYLCRFAPAIAAAREAIAALGAVHAARLAIAGPGDRSLWKHRRNSAGGAVNELASHMVDLALWCFGPMRDCTVLARTQQRPRRTIAGEDAAVDAEDRVMARLVSHAGIAIALEADFAAPRFAQSFEVDGARGTLRATIEGSADLYPLQAASFLDAIAGKPDGVACGFAEAAQVCAVLERLHRAPLIAAVA
jgi:myo-inositol 2-dehydrogenase/D-chiro-inositol 1-dehydrogenase